MLEISILFALSRYAYATATRKGYPGAAFVALAVVGWFGCGIAGAVIGYLANPMFVDDFSFGAVLGYILGVAVSGVVTYLIVDGLNDQPGPAADREADLADAFAAPRRRRDRDDDEPIDLQPAIDQRSPAPRARRTWQRKWD